MCGIFAVLGLTGDATANRRRVYHLAKRLRHRGPDSYSMDVNVDHKTGKALPIHTLMDPSLFSIQSCAPKRGFRFCFFLLNRKLVFVFSALLSYAVCPPRVLAK